MIKNVLMSCIIKGHVQGIGYRYFVQNEAVKLGLNGWVRNLGSGDVECEAEGPEKEIDEFLDILRSKHPWADVTDIISDKSEAVKNYKDFHIRF